MKTKDFTTEINSQKFADEVCKKMNAMHRFETRLNGIITDEGQRERIRKLFSEFIIEYHQ
jgi:hypothetical protein